MSFGGRLPSGQSPYSGQQQHQQYATQPEFYQQPPVPHQMPQPTYAQHQGIPNHAQQQHMTFNYGNFSQQHAPVQPVHRSQVQQPHQQQWGGFYDANSYGNGALNGMAHGMDLDLGRSGSLGDIGDGGMHLPATNEQYMQSPPLWQQAQQAQQQQLGPSQMQHHHPQHPSFHPIPPPQQVRQSVSTPHPFSTQVQVQQQSPRPRTQINSQRRPSQSHIPPQPLSQVHLLPQQHTHVQPPSPNNTLHGSSPQLNPQPQPQHRIRSPQMVQKPGLEQTHAYSKAPLGQSPSQSLTALSSPVFEDKQNNLSPQVPHQSQPSPQVQSTSQKRPSHTTLLSRQSIQQTPPEQGHVQLKEESHGESEEESSAQPRKQSQVQAPAHARKQSAVQPLEPPLERQSEEHRYQTLAEPQFQFVNLQDIQQIPFMASTFPTPQSLASPLALPAATHSAPTTTKHGTDSPATTPVMQSKPQPTKSHQQSPKKSASKSPAMATRKVSKSPAISSKPSPYHTPSLMVNLAEEFIGKARSSAVAIASTLHADQVEEYQKMIGTGLACLESALQSQRLSPHQEAQVRIRYATLLQEETANVTEAETTLTKGITLCDKHRMFDLKYYMQYLMMKALFLRNRKAALKALDQHIKDCIPYEHYSWFYAFRMLKASFYLEAGNSADPLALDNLRHMQQVATTRGDAAVCVFASLTEALILLKSAKSTPEMIQERIAQAAKYQCDPSVNIYQLEIMSLLIGLLMSLHREKQEETAERLRTLQKRIDSWRGSNSEAEFLLPVKKDMSSQQIISADTSAIIRPGDSGGKTNYLVMSFMTEMESTSLVFTLGGLVRLHKPTSWGKNQSLELWREGLKLITQWDHPRPVASKAQSIPLSHALKQRNWRIDSRCYLHVLLGLLAASQCSWDNVKQHKAHAESLMASMVHPEIIKPYLAYLNGAYCQGIGDFRSALLHYRDDSLSINSNNPTPILSQRHLALLAGMNQLWIMQHPYYENHRATTELLSEMEPLCKDHSNVEIQGAWSCVLASVVTHPPRQRNQRKEDAGKALKNIKGNALATAVGLVIARDLLYNNVLGDQALSCMQAANVWASRSGNPLWQSVVGGIMAETAEAKNEKEQAVKHWEAAVSSAQLAFARSS